MGDLVLILPAFRELVSAGLQSSCMRLCLILELALLGVLNVDIQGGVSPASTGIINASLRGSDSLPQTLLSVGLEIFCVGFTGLEFGDVDKIKVGGVADHVHLILTLVEEIREIFKLFSSRIVS